MAVPITVRTLQLDPPLVNGSGVVDVVSTDEDWNLPDSTVSKLGSFVTKTLTLAPRAGNPTPWVETWGAGSLVNSVGLANPGCHAAMVDWASLRERLAGTPIIVSLDGDCRTLVELVELVVGAGWASGIELNLSCPNVGGGLVAADPFAVANVVALARARTELPLFAKLTPASGARSDIARAAQDAGVDALVCGNTMPVRALTPDGTPLLGAGADCGLSGRALHHLNVRLVADVASCVDLPIVGLGGVEGLATAQAMFDAGASIIGVGSAAVLDPEVIGQLAAWLPRA